MSYSDYLALCHIPHPAHTGFSRPAWRAWEDYRAGRYRQAYRKFSQQQSADAYYNQGNALAHLGHYQTAIYAYQRALRLQAHHQDAQYNWALLKHLRQHSLMSHHQLRRITAGATPSALNEHALAERQWLNMIADDPISLLRRKLLRDYLKRSAV